MDNLINNMEKKIFEKILKYSKAFEDVISDSKKYEISIIKYDSVTENIEVKYENTKHIYSALIFGHYSMEDEKFTWLRETNKILSDKLLNSDLKNNKDVLSLIKKLLENEIIISYEYATAISYIVSIYNPAFNLIRFSSPVSSRYLFALIKLGIEFDFDYDQFCYDLDI